MDYLVNLSLLASDPELDARVGRAAVTIRGRWRRNSNW